MKQINRTVVSDGKGNVVAIEEVEIDVPAPDAVTPRQFRLELLARGLLSGAAQMLNGLPAAEKAAAEIEWEYATEVRRDHPMVLRMARQLSMSDADIEGLFFSAAQR